MREWRARWRGSLVVWSSWPLERPSRDRGKFFNVALNVGRFQLILDSAPGTFWVHGCPPTLTSHARRPPSANGSLPRSFGGEHGAAREFSIPRFWRARGTTTGVIVDTVRARSACGCAQPAIANRQYRHRRSRGEAAEASETGRNRAAIGPYCSPGRERSIYSTFMMPVGDGQQRALSSSRLGPASGQDLVSQLHKCALSALKGTF